MNLSRWMLAFLLVTSLSAQSWVTGQIAFRLTTVPKECPAERAGLKVGDILIDAAGVSAAIKAKTPLPVFRFDPAKAAYLREELELKFRAGEERKLGVVGDFGFLVTGVEPHSLAARAKLHPHDFLPQIDGAIARELEVLSLVDRAHVEGIDVNLHVIRWNAEKSVFDRFIVAQKYKQ